MIPLNLYRNSRYDVAGNKDVFAGKDDTSVRARTGSAELMNSKLFSEVRYRFLEKLSM